MRVEIDQSGKIGDTKLATVLALANGSTHSIMIPATVKRECIAVLREHYQRLSQPYTKLFAVCIFILLKPYLNKITEIIIDKEYVGKEADIKGILLNLCREQSSKIDKDSITFMEITRHSPAHHKAYKTFVGKLKPNRIIKTTDILKLLGK